MFELFIKRENAIFDVLQELVGAKVPFVVVGGYAVSAYKHRFSVDADIVVKKDNKDQCKKILSKKGFFETISKELEHVYATEFIRYTNNEKLPVNIDVLIDGIGSRQTQASFSFEELVKNSKMREIIGIEKSVRVLIPDKEMLIALKIHSGRLTDFRDVAALAKGINIDEISSIIWRGNTLTIKSNIRALLALLEKREFIDSFKGMFVEKTYDVDLKTLKTFNQLL